jgi:hypothetical protein
MYVKRIVEPWEEREKGKSKYRRIIGHREGADFKE